MSNVSRHATFVVMCLCGTATGVAGRADEPGPGRLRAVPRPAATQETGQDKSSQAAPTEPRLPQRSESLAELDQQWSAAAAALIARATAAADQRLAEEIGAWPGVASPPADSRQTVYRIPATATTPAWLADEADSQQIWADFLKARRDWADRVFEAACTAVDDDLGCEAFRLLAVTLLADPDHQRAREAGGWTRRVDDGATTWLWPEAARRQSRREAYSPEFGWLPKTWQPRYAEGLRRQGTRWVPQDELAAPRSLTDAPVWQSDHWRISHLASDDQTAQLAAQLEEIHGIWSQVFGSFAMERGELQRRFDGQHRIQPATSMQAVHFASRQQYVDTLEQLEPQIGRTLGIYWMPTKTAYFFHSDDADPGTVFHEATHQLFAESRRTSRLAGERHGFWVLEAVACYMESLERTSTGWRLGGLDHGRAPMAVERLTLDNFYVPLETLCSLGRVDFQARPDLPPLYSQISGLADFFINGQRGRYREAFVTYLQRVYTGSARPDSLAQLCGVTFAELDAEYRRHVSR